MSSQSQRAQGGADEELSPRPELELRGGRSDGGAGSGAEAALRAAPHMEGVSSSENPLASAPLWRPPDDVLHDINAIDIHNARLDLHNRQLPAIDPLVYQKTEIEELNLARNAIERVEPDIQNLATMRGLDLSDNRLTTLPLELRRCVALEGTATPPFFFCFVTRHCLF